MKDFLKHTLAAMVGVILAGVVISILGIVATVGMLTTSDTEVTVKEHSMLVLNLEGGLQERTDDNPLQTLLGNDYKTLGLDDILSAIRKAKDNDNITGIYLEDNGLTASFASREEIRAALADFKESGKWIVAYSDNYTQGNYYLASVADKVIVNPSGTLSWHGLASELIFYKDLMKKVGVEAQVFKVGTYKSAVEPYIGTQMSDANREQVTEMLSSIWGKLTAEVSTSRGIPVDSLNALADRFMDVASAQDYVDCGLADTLLYKDGVLDLLKQMSGREEDESLRRYTVEDMKNVKRNVPKDKSGNIIAVYYASGEIAQTKTGGASTSSREGIYSDDMTRDLRRLREDDDVKAVVLRVNSPGGSAYASEQIWREVELLKEKKPVIVSMGDYAASGGYYISCAATRIVADATTLTGSIGIFGVFPNAEELLQDKLGLHFDGVKTNRLADAGSLYRPFNTEESALMQQYIDRGYALFVKRVADGRGKTTDEIEQIAEGRVWTGEAALQNGLVDELGGMDKALSLAAETAGVEAYTVVDYPETGSIFSNFLSLVRTDYLDEKLHASLGQYYECAATLQRLQNADRIQARLPYEMIVK
jgi:protease-4